MAVAGASGALLGNFFLFWPSASPLGLRPPKSGRPAPNSPISSLSDCGFQPERTETARDLTKNPAVIEDTPAETRHAHVGKKFTAPALLRLLRSLISGTLLCLSVNHPRQGCGAPASALQNTRRLVISHVPNRAKPCATRTNKHSSDNTRCCSGDNYCRLCYEYLKY